MDVISNLALGFSVAFSLQNIFYCLVGVTLGTFIGILPGVGPLVTIAMLLPLTFGLPPEGSLIMLAGIYYGAQYGGSTTAILVNIPGEPSSVVTCIDGYKMARQGRAGPALAIAAIGSLIAGIVGTLLIALFGPLLAGLALQLISADYFSLMLMAVCSTAALVKGSVPKGMAMAFLGIFVGLSGIDVNSGVTRFSFGIPQLVEGIDFVVVAMGLFAITEIVVNLGTIERREVFTSKVSGLMPTLSDLKASFLPILRGTSVGSFFGILPGVGASMSAFAAYMLEKKISRTPERFGNGAIEGVASPEAANNAAAQTSFIPTLTLGVPGSPTMALMLGAMMIQGVSPGPQIMSQHPGLFWGLIVSMLLGNAILVILNLPLVGLWVRMLRVPYRWLFPAVLMFSCIGIYSVNNSAADVLLAAAFGLIGWMFVKMDCEPAPFILGFILGPMMEENLRRALILSRGDPTIFLTRPFSAFFLIMAVGILLLMILPAFRRSKDLATREP